MELLLNDNAGILSILPSAATGLFKGIPYIVTIHRYVSKQMARAKRDGDVQTARRLVLVQNQLTELQEQVAILPGEIILEVDADKTLLLTCTFGSTYSKALALATGNGVHVEVFEDTRDLNADEMGTIVADYFRKERGKVPVFVRVVEDPQIVPDARVAEDPNVFLQLRRMLAKLHYTLNLDTFQVEPSPNHELPKQESVQITCPEVTVNVYNWYCSCEQFAEQINTEYTTDEKYFISHIQKDIGLYLYAWFQQSGCNHLTTLPMCAHILAVVLAVHNMEMVPMEKRQIRNASEI